ncbi:hypothetical protein ACT3CD_14010 [Geofilum sp. OHC36d9]|uniref:hypothetical protein n=1 Tax=Geofilum sp. OHC36d9 TaxID=3458413 RepID=UPI004034C6FA
MADKKASFLRLAKLEKSEFIGINDHFESERSEKNGVLLLTIAMKLKFMRPVRIFNFYKSSSSILNFYSQNINISSFFYKIPLYSYKILPNIRFVDIFLQIQILAFDNKL